MNILGSMNKLGIITQIEFDEDLIQNHIEAHNNKRLDNSQKIRAMICKQQSPRERA
jgi:hypothetical protein